MINEDEYKVNEFFIFEMNYTLWLLKKLKHQSRRLSIGLDRSYIEEMTNNCKRLLDQALDKRYLLRNKT